MNNLIIYIEVYKERPFNFGNIVLASIQKNKGNATLLDLDNFSSTELFNHSLEACKNATNTSLVINQKEEDTSFGTVINFINKLIRIKKNEVTAYLLGENIHLAKMLSKMERFTNCSENEFLERPFLAKKAPLNK